MLSTAIHRRWRCRTAGTENSTSILLLPCQCPREPLNCRQVRRFPATPFHQMEFNSFWTFCLFVPRILRTTCEVGREVAARLQMPTAGRTAQDPWFLGSCKPALQTWGYWPQHCQSDLPKRAFLFWKPGIPHFPASLEQGLSLEVEQDVRTKVYLGKFWPAQC